jgi:hypothetical protein
MTPSIGYLLGILAKSYMTPSAKNYMALLLSPYGVLTEPPMIPLAGVSSLSYKSLLAGMI